jgi:hypothetical protein
MSHEEAIKLERMLLNLIAEKRGEKLKRYAKYDGITIDSDSFENDAAAVKGLWLAVNLLQPDVAR